MLAGRRFLLFSAAGSAVGGATQASPSNLGGFGTRREREGWKIIFLSQLNPLFPTSLLNYLYGLTAIRFRTCILWVAIGQAPGLFLYAYVGTLGQLGLNLVRGKSHPRVIEYWCGLADYCFPL